MPYEKFADGTRKDLSEEIPFELPRGWAWTRVKYVTSIKRDEYVTRKQIREGKIPVILGGQEPAYYCDKSNHDGPCVVVSRSGASAGFASYWDEPIFVTDGFLFECVNGLTARYFYHWLKSFPFVKLQRGTGMPHVQSEVLNALLFPLPPLAEQKRIVAKVEELFAYADKIGETSKGIATTAQRIDKKILDLAIRGQLVAQDPTDEPASELLKRIRETKKVGRSPRDRRAAESFIFRGSDRLAYETVGGKTRCIQDEIPFDIPESWKWCRLGDLIQIIAGVSYQKNDVTTKGVRILRGGNLKEDANIYLNDDDVFLPNSYSDVTTSVMCGDIIIVASIGSISVIGRPAIARDDMPGVQIGAFLRIVRTSLKEVKQWLHIVFLGEYYRKYIREKSKGTNIRNLKAEYLNELLVPIPPLAEQKRIVAKVEELKAQIKTLTM